MKKIFSIVLIAFIVLSTMPINSIAQKNFAANADEKFSLDKYYEAIQLYKKAYTKVKSNKAEKNRILFQTAVCYYRINDAKNTETYAKRVIKAKYPEKEAYFMYADALRSQKKYEEALVAFQNMKTKFPDDPRAAIGEESCQKAIAWEDNPTTYEVEPNKKINTRESDFSPAYSIKKHNALVFTTSREGVNGKGLDSWTGTSFTDLFIVSKDKKGNWGTPAPLEDLGVINSPNNEGACVFDSKYKILYFTRCRSEKKKKLGCEIYTSEKKGNTWSEPELIPICADSFTAGHPALLDDLTLIFASNMPGGKGGKDLWMIKREKKNKPWGKAVNLGDVVNTSSDEVYPTIRVVGDKTYLYFSTNGRPGMGGLDMYRSEYVDGSWTEPENLMSPLNSSGDDFHIIFNDDAKDLKTADSKEMGFFTTNRKGGRGGDDIWSFRLPPLLFTLSGIVKDDSTKEVIVGAKIKLVGSDGTSVSIVTDETGSYTFNNTQILESTNYNLEVEKDNYYSDNAKETTVGLDRSKDLVHDFNLVIIPKKPIVLPDILYEFNKWDLLTQYEDSLSGLVTTMKENPNLIIELGSHTDLRGSEDYNDTLSSKRAKSCVDYIIAQGIEADRISPKGYGERVPRVLESDKTVVFEGDTFKFAKGVTMTEEYINSLTSHKEREAAHQLNRRTTFQIIGTDYVPKKDANVPVNGNIEIAKPDDANSQGVGKEK